MTISTGICEYISWVQGMQMPGEPPNFSGKSQLHPLTFSRPLYQQEGRGTSWPSVYTGLASANSANCIEKKFKLASVLIINGLFKESYSSLLRHSTYLHGFYNIGYLSHLAITHQGGVGGLFANAVVLYKRLEHLRIRASTGIVEPNLQIYRGLATHL